MPSVFHSEFDNFDQFVNTVTGAGSIHTAHGIMLQDIQASELTEAGGSTPKLPAMQRTKESSVKLTPQEELPECYVSQRKCPSYPVTNTVYPGSQGSVSVSMKKDITWLLLRLKNTHLEQEIPGWAGFVSLTGDTPNRLTTIDYYPVIN